MADDELTQPRQSIVTEKGEIALESEGRSSNWRGSFDLRGAGARLQRLLMKRTGRFIDGSERSASSFGVAMHQSSALTLTCEATST